MPQSEKAKLQDKGYGNFLDYYNHDIAAARLSYYNMLSSKILFSANVSERAEAHKLFYMLVKQDRLPVENDLESLKVLKWAWDTVDVGAYTVIYFKTAAKCCFFSLILLAILITIASVVAEKVEEWLWEQGYPETFKPVKVTAFLLSVFTSFVAAIMAFINPMKTWHELRESSAAIESAIWQFRTRTGIYEVSLRYGSVQATRNLQMLISDQKKRLQSVVGETGLSPPSAHKFVYMYSHTGTE